MKILAIQNRMGIGDTVMFLPYFKAISKKFNISINLLVRENSKVDQFLFNENYIDKIYILDRNKHSNGRHDGIIGAINLIRELKQKNFDMIFIFNSSLRFNIIAKFAGIKQIYQYPLFKKKNQHITNAAKKFIKDTINIHDADDPKIEISNKAVLKAISDFNILKQKSNILLGTGGSGPTKRIPAKIFINSMKKINKIKDCRFFIATGKNKDEKKILDEIVDSEVGYLCTPLDNLKIKNILPVIKNCNAAVCNDTSFSHLSAALGINTITLMADTPLIYGSYSSKMHPIIPDGEIDVTHGTMGKDKINPDKIFEKLIKIIN